VSDTAGSTAIYYEDVAVYTDSEATVSGNFSKASSNDLTVTIAMNGNTVKEIKNGSVTLTAGTDYTASTNSIIFKSTYLKNLADGMASFTVSYYPLGETGMPDTISDNPATTTVSIATYTPPADLTATYGDALSSVILPSGWKWEDTGTVGNAGNQTHKASYTTLSSLDVTIAVTQKAITVSADNKEKCFGAADPALTYIVNPALINGDTLTGSLKYTGSAIGTYDIIEDTAFDNPNYTITFVKGTMTIKTTPTMDEVTEAIKTLPEPDAIISTDDIDKVIETTKTYEALSDEEKMQIPQDIRDKLTEVQEKAGDVNRKDGTASVTGNLPWNVRLEVTPVEQSEQQYENENFVAKIEDKNLIAVFDIKLIDTLTGKAYELPVGETVTVTLDGVDLSSKKNIVIAHQKADGTVEYLDAVVSGNTVSFKTSSFGLYGIVADKATDGDNKGEAPKTGDNTNMMLWPWLGSASLFGIGIIVVTRKRRKIA